MRSRSKHLPLLILLCSSAALHAQTPSFPDTPFTSSVEDLRAASAAVPADHDHGVQILYDEGQYVFAADQTLAYRHRMVFRVDAQDSVQGWSEAEANWDPWNQKPAQLHARILQTDGRFVELDQKTVTDAPVSADDSETYSSEHVRRAPLPGVAVGSIVEEVEETEEKTPYFAGGGLYRFFFRYGVPLAHARLIIDLPAALPYKEQVHGLPGIAVTRTGDSARRRIVYDQRDLAAAHNSDIDLATNDPAVPFVEFSTGTSWAEVASIYARISDPETVPEDTASILPAVLPAERLAKIRAIVTTLHREVRYTGVEFGAARLQPQRPSEVLHRHYGDCKDKATLLVAMLRQAGIPANLALLSTGPGRDVTPDLAGMNQFNHAIVYVPAAGTEKAIWIDATATYFQPGYLPWEDSGRLALIVAPGTTALTRTPDPAPANSSLLETREFKLAAYGPSHVTETSETRGIIDATYRSLYSDTDNKKTHEELEHYARTTYSAKTLTAVTHGDGADLSQPFHLSLEMDGVHRGLTVMDEAVVVIYPSTVLSSLPNWFRTAPAVIGPDTTAEARRQIELAEQSRSATYTFRPFSDERRFRIIPPDGFRLRTLPAARTTQLGPATLTETYAIEPNPDGKDATTDTARAVTVTLRFDSGSGSLTADQALAMRSAVLELDKREYIGIYFDQAAAKAFADGHARQALDIDRALIAAHPAEPLHHTRLGRLLLDAGIGDGAHAESLRATQLDPKSSVASESYGWTLEHDELGDRFGKGFDLAGAIAAHKHAIELDPDDDDPRFSLAILYEFDARGIRYAPDANLPLAIATYRELLEKNKDKEPGNLAQWQTNLMYALLFANKFDELDKFMATLPGGNGRAALAIASAAAQHGAAAGIAQAEKGNVESADRNKNLLAAGALMAQMRRYPEAAALLQAGIAGAGDNAPATAREIEAYKDLKPVSLDPLPATDPAQPVQAVTFGIMAGTLTAEKAAAALARSAYDTPAQLDRDVQKTLAQAGFLHRVAANSGISEPVLLDQIAGHMTFTATGDDALGYAIAAQTPGSNPDHFYVIREDGAREAGAYRIVDDASGSRTSDAPLGREILHALAANNPKQAKAMLDWRRDLMHRGDGDDPLSGPLLPRFWTVNSAKEGADSPAAMRLAAISLIAWSMDAANYIPEIAAARDKATGQRQTDLNLLLASVALGAEQPAIAQPALKILLDQEPDSSTALGLSSLDYEQQHDSAGLLAMLAPRLAKKPKDVDVLHQEIVAYEMTGDFTSARKYAQAVLDSGKATGEDYNNFAWLSLFDNHFSGPAGEETLKAAQQATQLTKQSTFADLHTLACIYAALGRTTEARQTLDQAMYAGDLPQPDSASWYALGLIYEQYGAINSALAAYRRVHAHDFDDHTFIDPAATFVLAQRRIAALAASAASTPAAMAAAATNTAAK